MMPEMDGREVCRALKAHPRTRAIQVMMVTALDGTPQRVEGLDCGADDYVAKPVRHDEFLARTRSLLRARRLIEDLEEARAKLAIRNSELEELEALKETLAQTLIHDLKNPLTAVVGNLQLIELCGDENAVRLAGRGREATNRLQRMILDLLDVAGLEERRLVLRPGEIDAVALVRAAVRESETFALQRRVRLVVEAPGEPCSVKADPSVLRRVIDNLVANAVEHSPAGSFITLAVRAREEGLEISVADQGSGIPEAHRERIFEKFARLELREAGLVGNRGLGLTFCRLAVEAHGGTIWVDEAPGGGACFRLLLPAIEAAVGSDLPIAATCPGEKRSG